MRIQHIEDFLSSLSVHKDDIVLGHFDNIGKFTAERSREPSHPLFRTAGAVYRANYERGILVYYLIKHFKLKSVLEIGTGRGYTSFCAARAMCDAGIDGKIRTVDPVIDENFFNALTRVFPQEWFAKIEFCKGTSQSVIPALGDDTYDLVVIDGDHSYEATKADWQNVQDKFNKFVIFDDYHLPSKNDSGIQCAKAIDEIDWQAKNCLEPKLLILDRRLFVDDRGWRDDQIDYGQVIFEKIGEKETRNEW